VKPAYLSPEQIDGRGPDMRSDIHALGLVGWEMLTGREPWAGESLYGMVVKQREQDLPRLTTLRPGIPRPLLLAIEGALHKHPYDRWATVDEFLAQLRSSRPVLARPAEPAPAVAAATAAVPAPRPAPPAPPPAPPPTAPTAPTARMSPPPTVVAPATVTRPRRRRRWLATTVLVLALLAAGTAALVAYQGRSESRQTAAWLDSLTTGSAAGVVEIDSSADSLANVRRARAERLARDRARRDSLAAAEARRRQADSATRDEPRPAAADSAAERSAPAIRPTPPWTPRPDSAARRDSLVRRDGSARRDTSRSVRRDSTPPDTTSPTRPDGARPRPLR
jgi:hypothetical protein